MRRRTHHLRSIAALAIALVATVGATPAAQATEDRQRFITAPYADGSSFGTCTELLGLAGTCQVEHNADALTGTLRTDLAFQAAQPLDAVGLAVGDAQATIVATDVRALPVPALLYAVSLDEVSIRHEVPIGSVATSAITASLHLAHDACEACVGSTVTEVAPDAAAVDLLAVLSNPTGEPVPPGVVTATVTVATQISGVVLGGARVSFDGVLAQIEAAAPSLERTVEPPYAGAMAGRACDGDVGTTFVCRAAAARSTGRAEFDLAVISPVAGTAAGSGTASGTLGLDIDGTPAEPARAVVYVVDLHVEQADAYKARATPLAGSATAAIGSAVNIVGAPCTSCALQAQAPVVNDAEMPFRLDDRIPFVVSMTDVTGGRAATTVQLTADAIARLHRTAGTALVTLRAKVPSIRVIEIA